MDMDIVKMSFGYHRTTGLDNSQKQKVIALNAANVLGAIPIIGSIVGIARGIFFGYMMATQRVDAKNKTFCAAQIFRSVVEGFSLGSLFIMADVLVTLERQKGKNLQIEPTKKDTPRIEAAEVAEEEPVIEELSTTEEVSSDDSGETSDAAYAQEEVPLPNQSCGEAFRNNPLPGFYSTYFQSSNNLQKRAIFS